MVSALDFTSILRLSPYGVEWFKLNQNLYFEEIPRYLHIQWTFTACKIKDNYDNLLTPRPWNSHMMMYHHTRMCRLLRAASRATRWQPSPKVLGPASEDRSDSSLYLGCFWRWSAPRELSACTHYLVGGGFQRSHALRWQTPSHLLSQTGGSQLTWMCCQTIGVIKLWHFWSVIQLNHENWPSSLAYELTWLHSILEAAVLKVELIYHQLQSSHCAG